MDTRRNNIIKYIIEIIVLIVLISVVYFAFKNSNINAYNALVKSFNNIPLSIKFDESTDGEYFLDNKVRLLNGTLSVRNPNKYVTSGKVYLKIMKDESYNIDDLTIYVDNKNINTYKELDDSYIFDIGNLKIEPYKNKLLLLSIYTKNHNALVKYTFYTE